MNGNFINFSSLKFSIQPAELFAQQKATQFSIHKVKLSQTKFFSPSHFWNYGSLSSTLQLKQRGRSKFEKLPASLNLLFCRTESFISRIEKKNLLPLLMDRERREWKGTTEKKNGKLFASIMIANDIDIKANLNKYFSFSSLEIPIAFALFFHRALRTFMIYRMSLFKLRSKHFRARKTRRQKKVSKLWRRKSQAENQYINVSEMNHLDWRGDWLWNKKKKLHFGVDSLAELQINIIKLNHQRGAEPHAICSTLRRINSGQCWANILQPQGSFSKCFRTSFLAF